MKSKREEALNTLSEVLEMINKASITLAKSFEETKDLPIDSFTSIDDIEWETLKESLKNEVFHDDCVKKRLRIHSLS